MPYIPLQYLIKPTDNSEKEIFLTWFWSQFNNGVIGRNIVNVEPIFYQGAIAGTEFLVFNAAKLYICLNFKASRDGTAIATAGIITFYDQANAANFITSNISYGYNAAADRYTHNIINLNNIFFSRIVQADYTNMIFNGYRITLL